MASILPNFLIVGMAKCGTSSLANYLGQHPDIFISEKKEPRYFSSQSMARPLGGPKDSFVEDWYVKNFDEYLELFKSARARAIGEASADTLYFYKDTIPLIKQTLGDPKILIILRDPVKRAFSAYQHLVRDARESETFEEGLNLEQQRIRDNYELIYHYREVSKYHLPVMAFLENFSQVKVILSDELKTTPNDALKSLFMFLDVDSEYEVETSMNLNVSGVPKSRLLHDSLQKETVARKLARPVARLVFPSKAKRAKMVNWLSGKNLDRMSINPETERILRLEFSEEIRKTSSLIGRDLSHWM